MDFDPVILSRVQFGFTVAFHIIWPTLTIGLGLFLLYFEVKWRKTHNPTYLAHYKFWVKIFALAFGMGVVTGIPLSYQLGTNFSEFSRIGGDILGPLISVEVMTAFFIEAAFIGVMVFGFNRVSPNMHLLATLLVVLGTHNSAFWIISANSWMHTPAGYALVEGALVPESWLAIIFNPSFPFRFAHMVIAAYISAALVILGVSAIYGLRKQAVEFSRLGLRTAVVALMILAPAQILMGDLHGLNTLKHQPVKIAAMEGLWETQRGAPLVPFAIIDPENETNHYAIEIPKLSSLILTHDLDGEVVGLKDFPKSERPPIEPVFYGFRLMVGCGMWFLLLAYSGGYLMRKKRLVETKLYLRLAALSIPLGFVATITGWIVAEVGRQPYVVYGLLRTADAVSPIPGEAVFASLMSFIIVYSFMFSSFLFYCYHLIKKGPGLAIETAEENNWLLLATHTAHVTEDKPNA